MHSTINLTAIELHCYYGLLKNSWLDKEKLWALLYSTQRKLAKPLSVGRVAKVGVRLLNPLL
jgi:hypothetical protein|tara:strand:+ start:324 stop:509 length:186 start_codon:yes stop_codon:yes gene_type:complete